MTPGIARALDSFHESMGMNHHGAMIRRIAAAGLGIMLAMRLKRFYNDWRLSREIADKVTRRRKSRKANFDAIKNLGDLPAEVVQLLTDKKPEEILEMLRKGEVSCVNVLRYFQKKALEVTEKLNCVTEFILEAEEWAQELDTLSPENRGLLHGLPISVKENFDIAGYDSTFGVGKRLENPAVQDALLVHVARTLGAVPFCKTNIPQTMLSFCCGNPIYGLTGNPYDCDRTCGGSSGGEGALLAAGGSCLGFGTDIGGSVRIPAHFSGCVGFKPTIARLSKKGAQGVTPGAVGVRGSAGIMGPTSVIVAKCFRALWASNLMHKYDPEICPLPFRLPMFESSKKLRIGYYVDDGWFPATPAIKRAVAVAKSALERLGHTLVPIEVSKFGPALMKCYFDCIMADDFVNFLNALKNEPIDTSIASNYFAATLGRRYRMVTGFFAGFLSPTMGSVLQRGANKSVDLWTAVGERQQLLDNLFRLWSEQDIDVCLCPASAIYAVPHRLTSALISAQSYAAVYNLVDFPAGVLPVTKVTAEDDDLLSTYIVEEGGRDYLFKLAGMVLRGGVGLPLAVQVVGRPYEEERVLAVMCQLEQELGPSW